MKNFLPILIFAFITLSSNSMAAEFNESDIFDLYKKAIRDGKVSRYEAQEIINATKNPYSPTSSHAGNKFLEALAWYNDITVGNKDGFFTLRELEIAFDQQVEKYLTVLFQQATATERLSAWKMVQKLKILEKTIQKSGNSYYTYRAKQLGQVSYDNEWNRKNTIKSTRDFERRVIEGSWTRPVLVKFGLTYCVHCLLMENLGSVPAVAKKYKGKLDVYKLWWNPNEPQRFYELNAIASEQGITSSPMFNLYVNGRLVKSGYAFPDENGEGIEEFLSPTIPKN